MEDIKNTVLIVDDEHVNLNILTHILETDYTVYTATDGAGAVVKAEELLPDLILLDIVMPETDGYETLNNLKNSDKTKDIPVIFISGLSQTEEEEKGIMLGAVDYISKPFSAMMIKLRVGHQIKIVNLTRKINRLISAEPDKKEQFS